MRWRIKKPDPAAAAALARELALGRHAARLLTARGYAAPEAARAFLDPRLESLPDPFLLPGVEQAVRLAIGALRQDLPIVIHGDYDADGLTATALLMDFFTRLGARVTPYVPHRLQDGYGLSPEVVTRLAQQGAKLLITVDCGISDHEAVRQAKQAGLDVIITDHHNPPDRLPPADVIVNPKLAGSRFPEKALTGVGVAFFFAGGLRARLRQQGFFNTRPQPPLAGYLGLAAIGTVADVAPVTGVNRALVAQGLKSLSLDPSPGLAALKKVSGLAEQAPLTAEDLGFRLAPRLNAAGRVGSPQAALDLLLARETDAAQALAQALEENNQARKKIQTRIHQQALALLEDERPEESAVIVLAGEGWHRGVVGIAAAKLAETFYRPVVLLAVEGELAVGSGRSIPGFGLHAALAQAAHLFEEFGGHDQAAGLTLRTANIEPFKEILAQAAALALAGRELSPELEVDALVGLEELNAPLFEDLARLAPFGPGNPEPVLGVRGLEVASAAIVGRDHLKLRLAQDGCSLASIGFGLGPRLAELGPLVDAAFSRHTSFFRGRVEKTWRMVDIRRHQD